MRGDDLRAMYLCCAQPYEMTLPYHSLQVKAPTVVLLQWNHKTVHTTQVSAAISNRMIIRYPDLILSLFVILVFSLIFG
jgi:hypothetical protein